MTTEYNAYTLIPIDPPKVDLEKTCRGLPVDEEAASTCHCSSTVKSDPISYLNPWRTPPECTVCGRSYMPVSGYAATPRYTAGLLTCVVVVVAIVLGAYLCKLVDIFVLGHWPRPDDPVWLKLHGNVSLMWLDRFYLLGGVLVIAMLGLVYLALVCVTQPSPYLIQPDDDEAAAEEGVSFLCCNQSTCPWYSCYFVEFAAFSGGDSGLILMALVAVVFGVGGAVAGMFRLVHSLMNQIKDRIRH